MRLEQQAGKHRDGRAYRKAASSPGDGLGENVTLDPELHRFPSLWSSRLCWLQMFSCWTVTLGGGCVNRMVPPRLWEVDLPRCVYSSFLVGPVEVGENRSLCRSAWVRWCIAIVEELSK